MWCIWIYTCENMHKLKMKNCVNVQNHYYWKESIINELKFNVCKAVVIIKHEHEVILI